MKSQVSAEIMESMPGRITAWLDVNYTNKGTITTYYQALKYWIMFIYGEDSVSISKDQRIPYREKLKINAQKRINKIEEGIERYFIELDDRDFLVDYKRFIHWLINKQYSNLTTRCKARCVKIFFGRQRDPRCKIDKEDWAQIKGTLYPKSTRPQTKDDILTKEQLKLVLPELSVHGRAMALFLLSSGARVGESCKLRMMDLHLDEDPPWVDIQPKYTKDGVGGRIMFFSYETREAIRDWHFVRKNINKSGRNGGPYLINPEEGEGPEDLVFNYTNTRGFQVLWNKALVKADRGADPPVIGRRDNSTKTKYHIYHVHTLRKFFRTNMGFEGSHKGMAGVPDVIVHGWMGHKAYLEGAYSRGATRLGAIYKANMHVVTVHEVAGPTTIDEALLDGMAEEIGAYEGLSEEDKEALSMKEKYLLVKAKLVKIKEEKKVPVAEMEVDAEEHDEFMDLFKEATASSRAPAK